MKNYNKLLTFIIILAISGIGILTTCVDMFCEYSVYSEREVEEELRLYDTHPDWFIQSREEIASGDHLIFGNPHMSEEDSFKQLVAWGDIAVGVDPFSDPYVNPSTSSSKPATSTQSVPKPKAETLKCEHEYVSEITTPATCKDKGEITYTCSKCGDIYTEAIDVDTNAHQYSDSVVETEPTCVEDGLEVATCSVCGDRVEKPISSLEHDYTYVVTAEPTCTEKGVLTYTCSRCTDSYTEDLDALGHTESEFIVDKEANWFFNGSQHKECTVCGEILITEAILSRFPTWYLYVGIGVLVLLITTITVIVTKRKRQ